MINPVRAKRDLLDTLASVPGHCRDAFSLAFAEAKTEASLPWRIFSVLREASLVSAVGKEVSTSVRCRLTVSGSVALGRPPFHAGQLVSSDSQGNLTPEIVVRSTEATVWTFPVTFRRIHSGEVLPEYQPVSRDVLVCVPNLSELNYRDGEVYRRNKDGEFRNLFGMRLVYGARFWRFPD